MEIRKATQKDARKISKLAINSIAKIKSDKYSKKQIKVWMNMNIVSDVKTWFKVREVFVAEDKGKIIGTVSLNKNKFSRFFVKHNLQGKGIGKKLLKFIENRVKKKGYKKIWMTSVPSAYNFYKKLGYKPKGKVILYSNRVRFTETKMEKKLK